MTKTQKITYYVLLTMVSVLFVFSGYSKLIAVPQAVQGFEIAHLPIWFMYFIGTCEILGGIALWFALSSKSILQKLSHLAGYGLFIILIGAVVTTIAYVNATEAVFPAFIALILCFVLHLGKKRNTSAVIVLK